MLSIGTPTRHSCPQALTSNAGLPNAHSIIKWLQCHTIQEGIETSQKMASTLTSTLEALALLKRKDICKQQIHPGPLLTYGIRFNVPVLKILAQNLP